MVTLLKSALTIGVLWLIGRSIDFDSALAHFSALSAETVALILALFFLQLLVASERLRLALLMVSCRIAYRVAFRAAAEGNFFSHTFISVLGSDTARIWRIQRSGVPLLGATSGVMLDRLIGVTGSHLMMIAALPFVMPRVSDDWTRSALLLLTIGFTAVLGAIYSAGWVKLPTFLAAKPRWARLQPIYDVARVSRFTSQSWGRTAAVLGHSLVVNSVNVTIFYLLLRDLGAGITLFDCFIVVPIVIQVSLLPISVGGWGVRESAAVIGFGFWGVPGGAALAASVIFGLLMLLFSLWGGLLWWFDRDSQNAGTAKKAAYTSKS
jgi:uncharacterized membrane protein YbhN (UPF0104 family)